MRSFTLTEEAQFAVDTLADPTYEPIYCEQCFDFCFEAEHIDPYVNAATPTSKEWREFFDGDEESRYWAAYYLSLLFNEIDEDFDVSTLTDAEILTQLIPKLSLLGTTYPHMTYRGVLVDVPQSVEAFS